MTVGKKSKMKIISSLLWSFQNILEHYFLDNHIYVEQGSKITYIAWADKLADINMRYFVNTPVKS